MYAAHAGETSYTKIWDMVWANRYGSGFPFGYNAIILSSYTNSLNCPNDFWHRYAQLIFLEGSSFPVLRCERLQSV